MRDNFVEFNDLVFTHTVKRSSESRKGEFDFFESITTIRTLRIHILLLVNPSEEYANALIKKMNDVLKLLPSSKFDKDKALGYQRQIQKLQQVLLKSEWSRIKKEIKEGRVLTKKEVEEVYIEKARDLGVELS
ncbi:hypothetical protein [Bacillus safensis]